MCDTHCKIYNFDVSHCRISHLWHLPQRLCGYSAKVKHRFCVTIVMFLLFSCKLNTSYKGSLYITAAIMLLFYIMYNIVLYQINRLLFNCTPLKRRKEIFTSYPFSTIFFYKSRLPRQKNTAQMIITARVCFWLSSSNNARSNNRRVKK